MTRHSARRFVFSMWLNIVVVDCETVGQYPRDGRVCTVARLGKKIQGHLKLEKRLTS